MAGRLTLTRAFEGAGLQGTDAERIATEIYEAIHDNVATKADLDNLRNELAIAVRDLKNQCPTAPALKARAGRKSPARPPPCRAGSAGRRDRAGAAC